MNELNRNHCVNSFIYSRKIERNQRREIGKRKGYQIRERRKREREKKREGVN